MKSANQSSAHRVAYTTATSPQQPGNGGRPMKPQPRRRWLAAIFTVFALLTAGGAHAQTPTQPVVMITDSTTAEYTNAAVTFTITFSGEGIVSGGFADTDTDITVVGGTKGAFTSITDDVSYTLVVTPTPTTNDGTLTVTVLEDAVVGATTGTGNAETVATQKYDTLAPAFSSVTTATSAVGTPISTVVYTAIATDGGAVDTRITYTLGTDADSMTFGINANTGAVTYLASPDAVGDTDVMITATDKGGNTATITVTVTVGKGEQADFVFADPTMSKMPTDDNFTVTASGGPGTGAVTYASGTPAVATVDPDSGEVDILTFGSTTITATKATDTNYNAATATYTLNVGVTHTVPLPNAASGFVTLRVDDTIAVAVAAAAAVNAPPVGVKFSLTTDLTLTTDLALTTTTVLTVPATVCLPTTDVPAGHNAVLYHYESSAWVDISTASASTRAAHVCGETTTFSPFAVGSYAPGTLIESLDLGTVQGIRLNLIYRVTTASGKTYYYLDGDGNGKARAGTTTAPAKSYDYVSQAQLEPLLNSGADTIATQEGGHDGTDDERSVIIGEYTLILPTAAEALVLVDDQSFIDTVPTAANPNAFSSTDSVRFGTASMLTANLGYTSIGDINPDHHGTVAFIDSDSRVQSQDDNIAIFAFFQVLPAPATADQLTLGTIPTQTYPVGTDISFTLPTASGGIGPLSYTLTRRLESTPLPGGLTFDPAVPAISSGMITSESTATELVYTVTDARLAVASLTFTVKTVTVNVDTDAGETVGYLDGVITVTNIGGGVGGDNKNDMRLILPPDNSVTEVAVTFYDLSAEEVPPAPYRVIFSDKTLDITLTPDALTFAATTPATVCLSTAGTRGGEVKLYRLPDAATDWVELTPATIPTIDDFVCGTTTTFSPFVVGYTPSITGTLTRLNEQILTRASQAMTASTLEAVARRVEAAAGGAASTAVLGATSGYAYQFGGQSSLSGLLKSHGKAMLEDNMEYEQLFDGASFVVPLSATEGGTGGGKPGAGALSLWGSSDFINLGNDNDGIDWDGQVVSINVGVDKLVGEDILAGFALSSNQSSFDYVDANSNGTEGEYNYSNTILHPYIGWFPGEDLKLWASVGFGSGEIEIDTEEKVSSTDTSQQSLSGGFSRQLLNSTKQTSGNTTTLNLKGDVSMTSVDVEENLEADFAEQKVGSTRLRVLVSGEQQRGLASGGRLMPSVEASVRYDGGDGVTGVGVELGGGLRYANPGGDLSVAGNVRTLLVGEYDELGVDFTVQLAPGSGRGLSLTLRPVWGKTQSAAERLWNDGASEITGGDTALRGSVDTEVGYGLSATMLGSPGILTPYTGMTTQDGGSSRLRLGGRFTDGNGLSLNLEGTQKNTTDSASHQVLLRGEVAF